MLRAGLHAPYTEREARGLLVFRPGMFRAGSESFVDGSWQAPASVLGMRITPANGAQVRTGRKGHQVVPFDCNIVGVRVLADRAGNIVFNIKKTSISGVPGRSGDSLTPLAIGRPRLTNMQISQDFVLYGWTTRHLQQDDVLEYEVLETSGLYAVTLAIIVARNDQP